MAIRDITDRRSPASEPHSWDAVNERRSMHKFRQRQRLLTRKVANGWTDPDAAVWPVRRGGSRMGGLSAGSAWARWIYRRCADHPQTSFAALQAEVRQAAGSPYWQWETDQALRYAIEQLAHQRFGAVLSDSHGWLKVQRWRDLPAQCRADLYVARGYLNDRHLDVRPAVARQGAAMPPADNANRLVTEGFSSPTTRLLWRHRFNDSRSARQEGRPMFDCLDCIYFGPLDRQRWGLCLSPTSPHRLETLAHTFGCGEFVSLTMLRLTHQRRPR